MVAIQQFQGKAFRLQKTPFRHLCDPFGQVFPHNAVFVILQRIVRCTIKIQLSILPHRERTRNTIEYRFISPLCISDTQGMPAGMKRVILLDAVLRTRFHDRQAKRQCQRTGKKEHEQEMRPPRSGEGTLEIEKVSHMKRKPAQS